MDDTKATHRLSPLFDFESCALVGASDTNNTGKAPWLTLSVVSYAGRYYPVNPRREEVHGQKAYPSLTSLPETPDMVIISIPRDGVADIIDECIELGVKSAVICASGFLEYDEKGAELQARITKRAHESGLLVIGPNCFGVASLANHCAAISGDLSYLDPGNVGVISNSGGLLNEIMLYGTARGLGFSHVVSSGNEAGVTAADLIDYFVADPHTDVILGILETVRDPETFVLACGRALEASKPIVLVKMGSSEKGARSTTTHTGAMAGSDIVYSALFRQMGVVRVSDVDSLIDLGALFANSMSVLRQRPLERTSVIEISGGGKGLISDTAAAAGVDLPDLPEATAIALKDGLPPNIYATNPIDSGGSWQDDTKPTVYPLVLETFASEPDIDIVVSRYTVPRSGPLGAYDARLDEWDAVRRAHPDRLFPVLSRTSDQFSEDWLAAVRDRHIPFVQGYDRGMRAIGRLIEYSRVLHGTPKPVPVAAPTPTSNHEEGGHVLSEIDSKHLLKTAGIPTVETVAASDVNEAVRHADGLGYPVVLKVIAPEIVHKSDSGGVRLHLDSPDAVRQAFADLQDAANNVGATFQGAAVQPMVSPGLEIVLGAHRDRQFGPVLLFGLGGVFVEVLHDIALRVAPLKQAEAKSMLDDIRGRALLDGARGQAAVDREAIADALCNLSDLMLERSDIASIDVNPAFAYPEGLLAVDAAHIARSVVIRMSGARHNWSWDRNAQKMKWEVR